MKKLVFIMLLVLTVFAAQAQSIFFIECVGYGLGTGATGAYYNLNSEGIERNILDVPFPTLDLSYDYLFGPVMVYSGLCVGTNSLFSYSDSVGAFNTEPGSSLESFSLDLSLGLLFQFSRIGIYKMFVGPAWHLSALSLYEEDPTTSETIDELVVTAMGISGVYQGLLCFSDFLALYTRCSVGFDFQSLESSSSSVGAHTNFGLVSSIAVGLRLGATRIKPALKYSREQY